MGQGNRQKQSRAWRPAVLVVIVGLVATACLGLAAGAAQGNNEDRLLRQRAAQAALVVTAAVPAIETPLVAAAELAEATSGNAASFKRLMAPEVGPSGEFSSASIWAVDAGPPRPVTVVGLRPDLLAESASQIDAFISRSLQTPALSVTSLLSSKPPALGYSYRSTRTHPRFLVYAERTVRTSSQSALGRDPTFAGLDFVTYLGTTPSRTNILNATTPDLPLRGRHASTTVRLGDATLLLELKPKGVLGGRLLQWLPWLIFGLGSVLTLAFALLTARLLRRQVEAQELATANAELAANQRSVAQTLQLSLLPKELPQGDRMEFGVRYQAGIDDIEIGGDWYDVIATGDLRVLAVMGDVSGRGLEAATIMASLRYSIRAFASQGDRPATILDKLNGVLDLTRDGHFATVLLAEVDLRAGTLVVASAGHPRPLLVGADGAQFVAAEPGLPIGIQGLHHEISATIPADATLFLFTDGLFERRGEVIDVGLDRLRQSAARSRGSLETVLSTIVDDLTTTGAHDDTALLGMRWIR